MSFKPLDRARNIYAEYPRQFWILIGSLFIDRLGGALIFPFFSLYITKRFDVGMTEVGLLFGLFAITSIAGSMFGGAISVGGPDVGTRNTSQRVVASLTTRIPAPADT